jgi:hypothetical protein
MGNVFTLAFVLALFHISNALQPESGIAAVTAAGLVVGNIRTRALRDLMEFKEGLTVMLIGMLFVLLAADVRLDEITRLGWPGLITVLVLMFVVRPLNVVASTVGSSLTFRERTFIAWLAPRGIVAAAVASFFAQELAAHGDPGGDMLRAMVFLVIAVTVNVQGLTGGLVARFLGVRRKANTGYAILGANELGRALGQTLRDGGEEIVFLDSRADATQAALIDGFRVVFGNALEERTRQRAELDTVAACIGMTQNEEVNLLFVRRAREEYKVKRSAVVLEGHITEEIIHHADAHILFGIRTDVDLWSMRLRRGTATLERWRRARRESPSWPEDTEVPGNLTNAFVPLAIRRDKKVAPVDDTARYNKGDELTLAIFNEKHDEVVEWLVAQGWDSIARTTPTDRQ